MPLLVDGSGGNPLVAGEMLRALEEAGLGSTTAPASWPLGVPARLADIVSHRIEGLPESSAAVLAVYRRAVRPSPGREAGWSAGAARAAVGPEGVGHRRDPGTDRDRSVEPRGAALGRGQRRPAGHHARGPCPPSGIERPGSRRRAGDARRANDRSGRGRAGPERRVVAAAGPDRRGVRARRTRRAAGERAPAGGTGRPPGLAPGRTARTSPARVDRARRRRSRARAS